ncbi:MAG: hypothetical protein ACREUE_14300, partial [Panacagrimonas sp.]
RLNIKGEFGPALEEAQRARELDPLYPWPHMYIAVAYEGLRQPSNAAASYRKAAEVAGAAGVRELSLVLAHSSLGEQLEAMRVARALEERARRGEVALTWAGWAYAAVGDRDRAFEWLDRAFEKRERPFRYYIRMPVMQRLADDPRYTQLLRRLERGVED